MVLLLIAFICVIFDRVSSAGDQFERQHDVLITAPINSFLSFQFTPYDTNIGQNIDEYCIINFMSPESCSMLHSNVSNIRAEYLEKEHLQLELAKKTTIINTQFICSPHLERNPKAKMAEMDNHFKTLQKTQAMIDNVHLAFNVTIDYLDDHYSALLPTSIPHLIIIHSCTIPGENHRILTELLQTIITTHLIHHLTTVIIYNYGPPIPSSFFQSSYHPYYENIVCIQVSEDTSYFEVPTMILIHQLAKHYHSITNVDHYTALSNAHLLYLHTKVVSYYPHHYPQIDDWRALMIYYLVEDHNICHSLLQSQEFDVLGVNFKTLPRDFRGNYWWTTLRYLAVSLTDVLSLDRHDKYTAETWLLNSVRGIVRIYNFHESEVDHHFTVYPQELYAAGGGLSQKQRKDEMMASSMTSSTQQATMVACPGMSLTWYPA